VPQWDGDIEPLHALYAARLRARIARRRAAGRVRMRDFLPELTSKYVSQTAMAEVAGAEESFRNVNTPEEAARFAVQVNEPA
jgi:molybdopterin-guanine dinucleotide biosynthesis protein A